MFEKLTEGIVLIGPGEFKSYSIEAAKASHKYLAGGFFGERRLVAALPVKRS
jgi:hypothetical protein